MVNKPSVTEPTGSAKDMADSAMLKAMGKLSPNVATASTVDGAPPSTPSMPSKPSGADKTTSDNNGGEGGKGNKGTGGNGGGGGWFSHQSWKDPQFAVGVFVSVLAAIGLLTWSLRGHPDNVQDARKAEAEAKKAKSDAIIAKNTGAFPPEYTQGKPIVVTEVNQTVSPVLAVNTQLKTVVDTLSLKPYYFDCQSAGIDEVLSGKNIYQLDVSNQTLRPPSGCMWFKVNGSITNLKGTGYLLSIPSGQGGHFDCGTYGVFDKVPMNKSEAECLAFINRHVGEPVLVGLRSDGYLTIN